jgi:hypothetical protein
LGMRIGPAQRRQHLLVGRAISLVLSIIQLVEGFGQRSTGSG